MAWFHSPGMQTAPGNQMAGRPLAGLVLLVVFSAHPFARPRMAQDSNAGARAQAKSGDSLAGNPDDSQEPFIVERYSTAVRLEKGGTGWQQVGMRIKVQSEARVQLRGKRSRWNE